MITGKLVAVHSEQKLSSALTRLIAQGGRAADPQGREHRHAHDGRAVRHRPDHWRGTGQQPQAGGKRLSATPTTCWGEAATTEEDALRYLQSYEQAIHAIGQASQGRGIYEGPGISIKLSALHPRYSRAQRERVMGELYPRLLKLAELARQYDIGLNIDAEEADRLEISLDLLEQLCFAPSLAGWNGIGFVVQAYQRRAFFVLDWIIDLARRSKHRLMVRLVKGAYWDSEIKRAQVDGLEDYPVFTRKVHTDVSYLACARKLLGAPKRHLRNSPPTTRRRWPASTTWRATTTTAASTSSNACTAWAKACTKKWWAIRPLGKLARPCRIYAPVGTHETLLAYLVRRLLENGANSFVRAPDWR